MRYDVTRYWYRHPFQLVTILLLPFSWLFGVCAAIRRWFFRVGLFKTIHFDVPVIIVGNITAGGTGKTPFVIWLVAMLKSMGYQPGIVSRGVGGKKHTQPYWVGLDSSVDDVGDEAVLLAKNTGCPVVIGVNRVEVVRDLLKISQCNVVISDDGLQHYRLGRDIEIVIVDGVRRFGNLQLLPAGPLREPVSRLNSVDFVIVNSAVTECINGEFEMKLAPDSLVSLKNAKSKIKLQDFPSKKVHVVAGIGHPQRFFDIISDAGFEVIPHVFPDHYLYQSYDLDFYDSLPIIMTEKDAVKCQSFADERYWYLSVTVSVDQLFQQKFLSTLKGLGVHHDTEEDFSKRSCRTATVNQRDHTRV